MRKVTRSAAGVLAAALVLQSGAALASEGTEGEYAADVMIEEVHTAAQEEGLPNGDAVLQTEVTLEFPDEDGEVTLSIEEAILRVAGRSVIDTEEHTGWSGLPWTSAGNLMHVYVDASVNTTTVAYQAPLPDAPDEASFLHYDVVESDWVPNTPIVPVINPLLLVPDAESPIDLPPLLLMHWGGPLKSVQGSGWLTGFHSAGTTPLGSSLDTQDRSDDPDAEFPFWVPLLEEGELAIADEEIDFAGFAVVTQDATCSRTVINVPPIAFLGIAGSTTAIDICASFGLLLGDGITFFDGEGPFNLRTDGALLWEPAPEPIKEVIDAVGDILGELPTDEILGEVLGLIGDTDLPDPEDELPGDDLPAADSIGGLGVIGQLLSGLGR